MTEQQPERILVITAHPDDVDFGAAGSVAVWTDAGIDVSYCIVTDGDAGGHDANVSRTEMVAVRRAEQEAAAHTVGVTQLTFLGYPDGRLTPSLDLRRDLARVIRQVRPNRVVAPSPQRDFRRIFASHPDHLAAGEAAMCAVYPDARNQFAFPELLDEGHEAWVVPEVWIMATADADRFVDITETFDRKLKALLCHVSQHVDPDGLEPRLREWAVSVADAAGFDQGRLGEGFRRVITG